MRFERCVYGKGRHTYIVHVQLCISTALIFSITVPGKRIKFRMVVARDSGHPKAKFGYE